MKKIIFLASMLFVIFLFGCEDKECQHNYIAVKTEEVTCVLDGYTIYECEFCKNSYKADIVRAVGHKTYVSKQGYEATCENPGLSNEYSCEVCKQVIKHQEKLSIIGHKYSNWEIIKEPTLEEEGKLIKTCLNDDQHKIEQILPALNKIDYKYEKVDPLCLTSGSETFKYELSDYTYTKTITIPQTGHSYDESVIKPTCLEDGYTLHKCHCGDEYKDTYVKALGHNYKKEVILPTCEEVGCDKYTCDNCKDTYKENEVAKLGHNYGLWEIETAPTSENSGSLKRICSNDKNHIDTVTLPRFNTENYTKTGKDSTCTSEGEFEYQYVKDEQLFKFKEIVPKKSHNYEDEVIQPTCLEDGYTIHTCKDCKYSTKDTYVDMLGHNPVESFTGYESTCTTGGISAVTTCSRCDKLLSTATKTSPQGHKDVDKNGICDTCNISLEDDYILISTVEELININNDLSGRYKLVNDITVNDDFKGIGSEEKPFRGYLYGDGFTISNLKTNLIYKNQGTIDNVGISNANIQMSNGFVRTYENYKGDTTDTIPDVKLGILTSVNSGKIINCLVKGSISVEYFLAIKFSTHSQHPSVKVLTTNHNIYMGIFSGINLGTISNCQSTASITADITQNVEHIHTIPNLMGTPLAKYLQEALNGYMNAYFGVFSGYNYNKIINSIITGTVKTIATARSHLMATYSRNDSNINCYAGSITGYNQSTIDSIVVENEFEFIDIYDPGIKNVKNNGTGYNNKIERINDTNYDGLVGKTDNQMNNLLRKY